MVQIAQSVGVRKAPYFMSTQEQFVQQFTRLFEHYSHALTSESQHDSKRSASAENNDNHLVAAARLAILELETNAKMERSARKYFAKPGEAEWGC